MTTPEERVLWFGIRRAVLLLVDVIERYIGISPRTAELRAICEAHRLVSPRERASITALDSDCNL